MAFMDSGCVPYEVTESNYLFLLMYADDMVIFF